MATETATLIFRADTQALRDAERRLRSVETAGQRAQGSSKSLAGSFKTLAVGAVSLGSAIAAIGKTIDVARQFDVINASLKTMTGSQAAATEAFRGIQEFAKTTPYDLAQVATAFTKLKARGLDPSMQALESYGNTASAMGKSLDQMIEAVADATTGEFERLKEFGIKAKKNGDEVKLTFQGVTTTIGANAGEIEGYLRNLGETNFGGAMAERAATLDGAISNLGDTWDTLFLTISQSAVGDLMKATTLELSNMLAVIDKALRSSQGKLTLEEQLDDARLKLGQLQEDLDMPEEFSFGATEDDVARQQALVSELQAQLDKQNEIKKVKDEQDAQKREEVATGEKEAAEEEAFKKLQDSKKQELENFTAATLAANMTQDELITAQYERDLAKWQEFLNQKLISQELFEQMKTELEQTRDDERAQLRHERLQKQLDDEWELFNNQADKEEADYAEKEAKKAEQLQASKDAQNAIEDVFLSNMDERNKKSLKMAMGLADAKKREEAKGIITSSYAAAMDAYKALAGIPIVGPALGAAAFAAVIAQGVQASAKALSGRALGGQVRAGESYVVGERGPEVLTMGGSNGRIITNEAMKSQGNQAVMNKTANVSFVIQANDTTGFDDLLESRRGQIVNMINMALNDNGQVALV